MRRRSPLFLITAGQQVSDHPLIAALIRRFGPAAKVADIARLSAEVVARCRR